MYNRDFDKDDMYKIGRYLPGLLTEDRVLIGRDVSETSPEVREYLTKGITDSGVDVYDMGLATTPMVYYTTENTVFHLTHEPVEITGKDSIAILVGQEDWKSIQETLYLTSIPGMRESIIEGMNTPIEELSDKLDW